MKPLNATLTLAVCSVIASGCSPDGIDGANQAQQESSALTSSTTTVLGDPLPGLTTLELDAFERGKILFNKRFTPEEGLGPHYNATSCSSCHNNPVSGGAARLYRNFYVARAGFSPDPLSMFDLPGLVSPIVPAFGTGTHFGATFTLEGGRNIIPDDFAGVPVVMA